MPGSVLGTPIYIMSSNIQARELRLSGVNIHLINNGTRIETHISLTPKSMPVKYYTT